MIDRTGDKGAVKRAVEHGGDQVRGRCGPQAQLHRGETPVKFGQQRRQAHGRGGLHRADRQRPFGCAVVAGGQNRFARQRGHALGIRQQAAAGAGQGHAAAVPLKQGSADFGFERLDPLRDVGLNGVELGGGAGDAAGARDGGKGREIGQFHETRTVSFWRWQHSKEIIYRECYPGLLWLSRPQEMDMSISTPLTALLGIRHPILLAPMDVIAGARLAAAVSEAGGFGILGGGYGERTWLEAETEKLRGSRSPFGVGFITWSLAKQPELLDIALSARPRAIMLSFGDPEPFAPRIKAGGRAC